ncbi:MAG: hypothetical protein LBS48_04830 [Treponema sp.]|jgi:hypothetical protein|nr:hypothetical protein [Treponema sp.]
MKRAVIFRVFFSFLILIFLVRCGGAYAPVDTPEYYFITDPYYGPNGDGVIVLEQHIGEAGFDYELVLDNIIPENARITRGREYEIEFTARVHEKNAPIPVNQLEVTLFDPNGVRGPDTVLGFYDNRKEYPNYGDTPAAFSFRFIAAETAADKGPSHNQLRINTVAGKFPTAPDFGTSKQQIRFTNASIVIRDKGVPLNGSRGKFQPDGAYSFLVQTWDSENWTSATWDLNKTILNIPYSRTIPANYVIPFTIYLPRDTPLFNNYLMVRGSVLFRKTDTGELEPWMPIESDAKRFRYNKFSPQGDYLVASGFFRTKDAPFESNDAHTLEDLVFQVAGYECSYIDENTTPIENGNVNTPGAIKLDPLKEYVLPEGKDTGVNYEFDNETSQFSSSAIELPHPKTPDGDSIALKLSYDVYIPEQNTLEGAIQIKFTGIMLSSSGSWNFTEFADYAPLEDAESGQPWGMIFLYPNSFGPSEQGWQKTTVTRYLSIHKNNIKYTGAPLSFSGQDYCTADFTGYKWYFDGYGYDSGLFNIDNVVLEYVSQVPAGS